MSGIKEISKRIPAKHILYVVDACYSGLALQRSSSPISSDDPQFIKKVLEKKARQIITAGGKDEKAVEVGGHGLFTKNLIDGLDGEVDMDDDRIITASELGQYLRRKVSNESEGKQTPVFGWMDMDKFAITAEGEFGGRIGFALGVVC